jgi:hypothetical protein
MHTKPASRKLHNGTYSYSSSDPSPLIGILVGTKWIIFEPASTAYITHPSNDVCLGGEKTFYVAFLQFVLGVCQPLKVLEEILL